MPRTSPSELTISVTTRPQPPWRLTRRRNAVSVMPAIGATANGDGQARLMPIRIGQGIVSRSIRGRSANLADSVRFHVRRVDFDADTA